MPCCSHLPIRCRCLPVAPRVSDTASLPGTPSSVTDASLPRTSHRRRGEGRGLNSVGHRCLSQPGAVTLSPTEPLRAALRPGDSPLPSRRLRTAPTAEWRSGTRRERPDSRRLSPRPVTQLGSVSRKPRLRSACLPLGADRPVPLAASFPPSLPPSSLPPSDPPHPGKGAGKVQRGSSTCRARGHGPDPLP